MLIYSRTIVAFIQRLEGMSREILSREVGLKVRRKRFQHGNYLYPIQVVCFEEGGSNCKLGYFEPEYLKIGINRSLMYRVSDETLANILRHELAHYLSYIEYGSQIPDHGRQYRQLCQGFNWGKEVYAAKMEEHAMAQSLQGNREEKKLLAKIQKLLSLGSSSNSHEAELATIKANELLVKHNLKDASLASEEEEFVLAVVASAPRSNEALLALGDILNNFFVHPVFSRGRGEIRLEVVGTRLNVELADYVAKFLLTEFEYLWKTARRQNPHFKGIASKNSFLRGLSKGLCDKLKQSHKKIANGRQLVALDKSLELAISLVYPELGHVKSRATGHCQESARAGEMAGQISLFVQE